MPSRLPPRLGEPPEAPATGGVSAIGRNTKGRDGTRRGRSRDDAVTRERARLQKRIDREVNRALMERLERDAERIAAHFGLRYREILPERANVKSRYGICYEDGTIKIRLRHATTRRPLKYSSLVATLCHELAHLRYFHHGETFQRYNARILEWARAQGIYRPEPWTRTDDEDPENEAPRRPLQLGLFGSFFGVRR